MMSGASARGDANQRIHSPLPLAIVRSIATEVTIRCASVVVSYATTRPESQSHHVKVKWVSRISGAPPVGARGCGLAPEGEAIGEREALGV